MYLPGLRALHRAMRRDGVERAAFSYRNNRAQLEVAFITDEEPYILLIAARGVGQHAFEVPVLRGYRVIPFLGADYFALLDALGVESNPENRFSVRAFFTDLNDHIPDHVTTPTQRPSPQLVALRDDNFEEKDKIYFLGWLVHGSDRSVTEANLDKTKKLLGLRAFEHCDRHNISSRWTENLDGEGEVTDPAHS